MAIVKVGAPLAGISGTIGGITYSRNASGPYARQWARPINPRSPNQSAHRAFQSEIPSLWHALTAAQKTAWDTFAALLAQRLTNSLGEYYYASGFNWFSKCNTRLLRMGLSTITATPTQARPAAPTIDDFRVCVAGTETDLCSGGTPTASTSYLGNTPDKAFDDSLITYWRTPPGTTTGWIKYVLTSSHNVKHLRIYPMDYGPYNAQDFTFDVYTSGAWQPLLTVTSSPLDTTGQWYDFYFPNPYPATTDYRINVTANYGGSTLGFMELEFLLGNEGASVICYPEDEFDSSPDYDLILQIAMGRSTGPQVMYSGFYEIITNSTPSRWYQLFQDELTTKYGTIIDNRSWYAQFYRQTPEGIRSAAATARAETIGA